MTTGPLPATDPARRTPTREVLVRRLAEGSVPGRRDDDAVVALAVEGGGMRGVVSAGMLVALEQLGLTSCVDLVVGTSAGALAGAFFVAGRALEGSVLFYTDLHTEPFLDRSRLLRGDAALDLDHLVDHAARARGLDLDVVAASPIPLYATVTPVEPGPEGADDPGTGAGPEGVDAATAHCRRVTGGADRAAAILKASAALPVLAGPPRTVDGAAYVDGGVLEQIPWRSAAALRATHVLVLPSQPLPDETELDTLGFIERVSVIPVIRRAVNDHIADLVATLPLRTSWAAWSLRAVAEGRATPLEMLPGRGRPRVDVVTVPDTLHLPSRLERDRSVLVDALIGGAGALVDHFGLDGPGGIVVEQRVVLTHPDAPVNEVRASRLAEVVVARATRTAAGSSDPGAAAGPVD